MSKDRLLRKSLGVAGVGLIVFLLCLPANVTRKTISGPAAITSENVNSLMAANEAYGKLSLHFQANRGQTDKAVKFLSRGAHNTVFLTSTETVLLLIYLFQLSRRQWRRFRPRDCA